MITTEGATYLAGAGVKGTTPVTQWYVFPIKGNYTPTPADVAATFPTLAQESTAYEGSTRAAITFGTVTAGAVDNSAAPTTLTATADETWYGVGVSSVPTKGALTGVLLHVQRFATPRAMTTGSNLQVLVELELEQPTP